MQSTNLSTGKNTIYLNALPYLNVLPLSKQRLDLWLLNTIGTEVPVQLIASLLKQQTFEIGIDLQPKDKDSEAERAQINSLQVIFDQFAQHESLKVGYPMLLLEDPALGRDIAAPLLIWELSLELAYDRHWILAYEGNIAPQFNEVLQNYLTTRFALNWDELIAPVEDLKSQNLLVALDRLAKTLDIPSPNAPKLYRCPSSKTVESTKNCIYWAGVLGEFDSSAASIEEPSSEPIVEGRSWHTRVAAVELSSLQEEALEEVFSSNEILLLGENSITKSKILHALLPGILADRGSCLVVSEQETSHTKLAYQMEQFGFEHTGVLMLQNEDSGKEAIINQLTELPSQLKQIPKFDEQRYSLLLQQFLLNRQQLTERYDAIQQKVLEGKDWTNAVGCFMRYHFQDGKQYLSRLLDSSQFEWTVAEFESIERALEKHEPLYCRINNLQHPLTTLQDYIFEHKTQEEANYFVSHELKLLGRLLRTLYQDYTTFIDTYADELRFDYERHVKDLKYQTDCLLRALKVYQDVYGNSFDNIGSVSSTRLRIMSVFSKKHQQIRAAKEQIFKSYENLKLAYEGKRYFEYKLKPVQSYTKFHVLVEGLENFKKAADDWLKRVPKLIKQKVKELTIKLPLKPHLRRGLGDLEQRFDNYLEQLEETKLFKETFNIKSSNATARESYLRNLLEKITVLEHQLDLFPAFYHWYKDWLRLGSHVQQLVKALVAVRPASWQTAFKSWYYYHFLDRKYSLQLPDDHFPIKEHLAALKELRTLLLPHSISITKSRQNEILGSLQKEKAFHPNQARAEFQTMSIEDIIKWLGIEVVKELFPLIITTPAIAERLFKQTTQFDLLVIEDAHLLEAEKGNRLNALARQQLVLGEGNSMYNSYLNVVSNNASLKQLKLEGDDFQDSKALVKSHNKRVVAVDFNHALYEYLGEYLPQNRIQQNVGIRPDFFIDLVIFPVHPHAPPIAIIIDGWMKAVGKYDYLKAIEREEYLKQKGYIAYSVWSIDWWRSPHRALQQLVAFVLNWDKEAKA